MEKRIELLTEEEMKALSFEELSAYIQLVSIIENQLDREIKEEMGREA